MVTSVEKVMVRHVRPEPGDEKRLRVVVAELQAASILRAARALAAASREERSPGAEREAPANAAEAGEGEG